MKEWKKNGGIQAAYDWEKKRANNYQKGNKSLTEESIEMDKKLAEATETYMQLAEFIAKVGTEYQDEPMLRKAKEILGVKRYITFKLENNIELTDEDKKIIIRNLK